MRRYKLFVVAVIVSMGCAEAGVDGFSDEDSSGPLPFTDSSEDLPDASKPDGGKPPIDAAPDAGALPDANNPPDTSTPPDSSTPPDTSTPPDSSTCVGGWQNLLQSGNFDGTNTSWTEFGGGYSIIYGSDQVSSIDAASAPNLGWMGGVDNAKKADNTHHELHQTVTVPVGTSALRLRGKVCFESNESIFQFSAVDVLTTTIQSTSGSVLETIASDSNLGADYAPCSWGDFTLDLDGTYAGQTVRLHFLTETDGSDVTSFYLDDMALEANVICP